MVIWYFPQVPAGRQPVTWYIGTSWYIQQLTPEPFPWKLNGEPCSCSCLRWGNRSPQKGYSSSKGYQLSRNKELQAYLHSPRLPSHNRGVLLRPVSSSARSLCRLLFFVRRQPRPRAGCGVDDSTDRGLPYFGPKRQVVRGPSGLDFFVRFWFLGRMSWK